VFQDGTLLRLSTCEWADYDVFRCGQYGITLFVIALAWFGKSINITQLDASSDDYKLWYGLAIDVTWALEQMITLAPLLSMDQEEPVDDEVGAPMSKRVRRYVVIRLTLWYLLTSHLLQIWIQCPGKSTNEACIQVHCQAIVEAQTHLGAHHPVAVHPAPCFFLPIPLLFLPAHSLHSFSSAFPLLLIFYHSFPAIISSFCWFFR
jgi:hypothetical protein